MVKQRHHIVLAVDLARWEYVLEMLDSYQLPYVFDSVINSFSKLCIVNFDLLYVMCVFFFGIVETIRTSTD